MKKNTHPGYQYLTQEDIGTIEMNVECDKNRRSLKVRRKFPWEIKSMARKLRRARKIISEIMPVMEPYLRAVVLLPHLAKDEEIRTKIQRIIFRGKVTMNFLEEAERYLSSTPALARGRELDFFLAASGAYLASCFNERTGDPHWQWVGEILAEKFPDARSPRDKGLLPDQMSRDLSSWARKTVKRFNSTMADPQRRQRAVERHLRRDLIRQG